MGGYRKAQKGNHHFDPGNGRRKAANVGLLPTQLGNSPMGLFFLGRTMRIKLSPIIDRFQQSFWRI